MAPSQLTYMTHPTISGISPASGPPAGGTRVTVHGARLTRAELVQVGTSSATNFTVEPDGARGDDPSRSGGQRRHNSDNSRRDKHIDAARPVYLRQNCFPAFGEYEARGRCLVVAERPKSPAAVPLRPLRVLRRRTVATKLA